MTYRIDNTICIRAATALLATTAILGSAPQTATAQQATYQRQSYYYPAGTTYRQAPASNRAAYYYYPQTTMYRQAPTANRVAYYYPATTTYTARPAATTTAAAAAPATTTVQASTGDPYGFINWLNGVRAQYGLGAVGYDPNLANWAAVNNAQQNARGLGHHVMGPSRRQNCAMGSGASIGSMWMNSPGHRANLLAPDIRYVGIAGSGSYWTLNAY